MESRLRSYEVRLTFVDKKTSPGSPGRLQWTTGKGQVPAELIVRRGDDLGIFVLDGQRARFVALEGARPGPSRRSRLASGYSHHRRRPIQRRARRPCASNLKPGFRCTRSCSQITHSPISSLRWSSRREPISYLQMPREQDPSVNFNWIQVRTLWPGASAEDVEHRVTDPLEEGIGKVADIKFVSSTSRDTISSILIRFEEMDSDEFDKRVNDLRREIQSKLGELPDDARQPEIIEITSANAFPTATLAVTGRADDERLRKAAVNAEKDIERIPGVDRVDAVGRTDPEIHVLFSPQRLVGLGISPVALADTVSAYFRDLAAGSIHLGDQDWFVRLEGTASNPEYLEGLPIITAAGELPLRTAATIVSGRDDPTELVSFNGQPAVLLSVFKAEHANNLRLLEQIRDYVKERNVSLGPLGVQIAVLDDQTQATRHAIGVMENNALIGLLLVLFAVWLFLGFRIALFTSLGIPFALAGTFLILGIAGQTLNSTTLLAVVIALGMLVDDGIVIAEAVYHKLQSGLEGVQAAIGGAARSRSPGHDRRAHDDRGLRPPDAHARHSGQLHAVRPCDRDHRAALESGRGILDAAESHGHGEARPAAPVAHPARQSEGDSTTAANIRTHARQVPKDAEARRIAGDRAARRRRRHHRERSGPRRLFRD